ncbi:MAG: DNA-processing protein DprA [Armatimonadetes bacterium]|nr:DNA-processing protein DprA [Anaerolineae bacterium]
MTVSHSENTVENTLRAIPGIGVKRSQMIRDVLKSNSKTLDDLLGLPADSIKRDFKLPINVAEAIVTYQHEHTLDNAATAPDFTCLTPADSAYPTRLTQLLGGKAPTELYIWGNLNLLARPAVGLCGSRKVSEQGLKIAADVVEQLVALDYVIVSGHANGVDTMAHQTALAKGGATIIVLAEGMGQFKLHEAIKALITPDNVLIISEFAPTARWTKLNAMTRNKTIVGLSDAVMLVESRLEGGTFDAGKTALSLKQPLFVAEYKTTTAENAGNAYFLKRGAIPLKKSAQTGRANVHTLVHAARF